LTFFSLYYFTSGSSTTNGLNAGYAEAGDFIFLCLVIIANSRVLVTANEYGGGLVVLFIFSICFYILTACLVTEIFTYDDQYKTYYHIWSFPSMYFAVILFTFVFAATDKVILTLRRYRKIISQ